MGEGTSGTSTLGGADSSAPGGGGVGWAFMEDFLAHPREKPKSNKGTTSITDIFAIFIMI